MHQLVGCGVDQGFTRAEHSYCLEYKAGGVGGVGGHENKVGGAAEFAILVESAGDRSASAGHGVCVWTWARGSWWSWGT